MGKLAIFLCRMVIEWREHEHAEVEEVVRADLNKLYVHVDSICFGVLMV